MTLANKFENRAGQATDDMNQLAKEERLTAVKDMKEAGKSFAHGIKSLAVSAKHKAEAAADSIRERVHEIEEKAQIKAQAKAQRARLDEMKHPLGVSAKATDNAMMTDATNTDKKKNLTFQSALALVGHQAAKKAKEFHYTPTPRENKAVESYSASPSRPRGKPRKMPSLEECLSPNPHQKTEVASSHASDSKVATKAQAKTANYMGAVTSHDIGKMAVKKADAVAAKMRAESLSKPDSQSSKKPQTESAKIQIAGDTASDSKATPSSAARASNTATKAQVKTADSQSKFLPPPAAKPNAPKVPSPWECYVGPWENPEVHDMAVKKANAHAAEMRAKAQTAIADKQSKSMPAAASKPDAPAVPSPMDCYVDAMTHYYKHEIAAKMSNDAAAKDLEYFRSKPDSRYSAIALAHVGKEASKLAESFKPSVTPQFVSDAKTVVKADAKVADAWHFAESLGMNYLDDSHLAPTSRGATPQTPAAVAADSKTPTASTAKQSSAISLAKVGRAASSIAETFEPTVTPRHISDSKTPVKASATASAAWHFAKRHGVLGEPDADADHETASGVKRNRTAFAADKSRPDSMSSKRARTGADSKEPAASKASAGNVIRLADVGPAAAKLASSFKPSVTPQFVSEAKKPVWADSKVAVAWIFAEAHGMNSKEGKQFSAKAQSAAPSVTDADASASKAPVAAAARASGAIALADVGKEASKKARSFKPSVTPRLTSDSKMPVKADAKVADAWHFAEQYGMNSAKSESRSAEAKAPMRAQAKAVKMTGDLSPAAPRVLVDVKKPHESKAKSVARHMAAGAAAATELASDGAKGLGHTVRASAGGLGRMAKGTSIEIAHGAKAAGEGMSREMEKAASGMKKGLSVAAKGASKMGNKAAIATASAMGVAAEGAQRLAHASEVGAAKAMSSVRAASKKVGHKAAKAGDTIADDSKQMFKGAKKALATTAKTTGEVAADTAAGIAGVSSNIANGSERMWSKTKSWFSDMKDTMQASARMRKLEMMEKRVAKNRREAFAEHIDRNAKLRVSAQGKPVRVTMKPAMSVNSKSAVTVKPGSKKTVTTTTTTVTEAQKVAPVVHAQPTTVLRAMPVIMDQSARVIEHKVPVASAARTITVPWNEAMMPSTPVQTASKTAVYYQASAPAPKKQRGLRSAFHAMQKSMEKMRKGKNTPSA